MEKTYNLHATTMYICKCWSDPKNIHFHFKLKIVHKKGTVYKSVTGIIAPQNENNEKESVRERERKREKRKKKRER